MKKIIVLLPAFLFCCLAAIAQKSEFHTPAEILQIMTESKMNYELAPLENAVMPVDHSENINLPLYYRKYGSNGFSTKSYNPNAAAVAAFEKAETAFGVHNYTDARKSYIDSYNADTTYYLALTYAGQTYGLEKEWDKAIEYYEKAIRLNYIDYLAHWFLADAYISTGRKEEAKKQILIAHILNRNNKRIIDAMYEILKENKLSYNSQWQFTPQMELKKKEATRFEVKYKGIWLGYALAKALWEYEPGYRATIGATDSSLFHLNSEKEGLVGVLTAAAKEKKSSLSEDILSLRKALDKKLFEEYAYYEILLPEHPFVAYNFPESLVDNIAEYIVTIRCH